MGSHDSGRGEIASGTIMSYIKADREVQTAKGLQTDEG